MGAKKEPGSAWRPTTVLVRADIYASAQEQGIDISDTCNRALADLLGFDYRQQQLDSVPVPPPVIIAKDGGMPSGVSPAMHKASQPPVINADDPKAAKAIASIKRQPVKKPAPLPPEPAAPAPVKSPEKAMAAIPAKKAKKSTQKKASKGDGLKKFIAETIMREDADDAIIAKEDLYQLYARSCREQKVSPVPDAKSVAVALKTKFAFREKSCGGKPCWIGVQFR